jgi:hypothetical protein
MARKGSAADLEERRKAAESHVPTAFTPTKPRKERKGGAGERNNRAEGLALLDWKNEKRKVDAKDIYTFAQLGMTYEEMGGWYGITKTTLINKISNDLELLEAFERGKAELKMSLRRKQLESAMVKENPIMQIFLGKNILCQRDIPKEEEAEGERKASMPAWLATKLQETGATSPSPASSDSTAT